MKNILAILIMASAIPMFAQSGEIVQEQKKVINDTISGNPDYDKALAERLGADEYGMKNYFFVLLKTGPNKSTDKVLRNESFKGHMGNIQKLVEDGKLIVAGPFEDNDKDYEGIFILNNISTAEEAEQLLLTDPAIRNGYLAYEIIGWYGSAALPEYLPASDRIWRTGF